MEFYSKSQPNLVAPELQKTLYKMVGSSNNNLIISERISAIFFSLYKNYIKENIYIFILIVSVLLFLLICYLTKTPREFKENKIIREPFSYSDYERLKNIKYTQTAHLRNNDQPSFNPTQPLNSQNNEVVNFPPEKLPINLQNNNGLTYTQDLYGVKQNSYPPLSNPDLHYNHDNVYQNDSRSYYNGTFNTYQDDQDTDIKNPLGFSNEFNTTTGHFVGQMSDANNKNLVDYQSIIQKTDKELTESLKIGPKYLDSEAYNSYNIEPPYSD